MVEELNMLTEKDYCDYDTCLTLGELGFPLKRMKVKNGIDGKITEDTIVPVLLYEAQKWLRKEKNIHIEVYACVRGYIYELCKAYKPDSFSGGTTIYTPNDVDNPKLNDAGRYDDFEICLLEGINEAIKILKENKITLG